MRTNDREQTMIFHQTLFPVILSEAKNPVDRSAFRSRTTGFFAGAQNDKQGSVAVANGNASLLHKHGCYADVWIHGDDLRAGADASWLAAVFAKAATLIQPESGNGIFVGRDRLIPPREAGSETPPYSHAHHA